MLRNFWGGLKLKYFEPPLRETYVNLLGSYLEATFVKQFSSLLRKRERNIKEISFVSFLSNGFP